jgi:hypothetical protein
MQASPAPTVSAGPTLTLSGASSSGSVDESAGDERGDIQPPGSLMLGHGVDGGVVAGVFTYMGSFE